MIVGYGLFIFLANIALSLLAIKVSLQFFFWSFNLLARL